MISRLVCLPLLWTLTASIACSGVDVPSDLSNGFSVKRDGFSFENFGGTFNDSRVSTDTIVRMFGKEAACVDARTACVLKPGAAAWARSVNEAMDAGRCEGMAVTSQLFFMGVLKPQDCRMYELQLATTAPNRCANLGTTSSACR
jgi:hypothetical protein